MTSSGPKWKFGLERITPKGDSTEPARAISRWAEETGDYPVRAEGYLLNGGRCGSQVVVAQESAAHASGRDDDRPASRR